MPKPSYIKFDVDGSDYVYDSFTNAVVGVDPGVRQILDDYFRLDRHELQKAHPALSEAELSSSIEFIEDALEDGLFQPLSTINFASALSPEEFQAAMETTLPELSLSVTEQCNQFCSYCHLTYSRREQPAQTFPSMTWEVARNSLDRFLEATPAERPVNIAFYGGEPLLNWEVVHRSLLYLRESYPNRKVQFRLISNLTRLNKNILETLIDFDAHLQVSLDGPQHIHDAGRPTGDGHGTYQRVYGWLAEIRALNADYFRKNIFLHCTFNKQNDILEIFRFFSEGIFSEVPVKLGYVSSSFADRFSIPAEYSVRHEQRIEQLIEMYLVALRTNAPFRYDFFWEIVRDPLLLAGREIGAATDPHWPNQACMPGVRRLFATTNGTFYPCEKFSPEGWDIGGHANGLEIRKAQHIFQTYASQCQEMCQECWAHRLCSFCYLSIVSENQVDTLAKAGKCDRERSRIIKGLRRFVSIWEKEPPETHDHPFSLHYHVRSQKSS